MAGGARPITANSAQGDGALAHFKRWVPKFPFATDNPRKGVWRHLKPAALRRRFIQPNEIMTWCLTFDCDHDVAFWAAEEGLLPPPNLIVLNPDNGRGHLSYFLKTPVPRTDCSRVRPMRYAAKIERGMVKRLDADPGYVGLITKNPLNADWRVIERHNHFYGLGELDEYLHAQNCVAPPKREASGLGRNCALFDDLRQYAYRDVLDFKRGNAPRQAFEDSVREQAVTISSQFTWPLPFSEVQAVARSVSKWVWANFDDAAFRQRQSELGQRGNEARWGGYESQEKAQPWEAEGISRATYFRRQRRTLGKP
jgi:hypothetical protein